MKTSSLYVHFPFCRHKCNYCDFYSIVELGNEPAFFDALFREIDIQAESSYFSNRTFSTLYVGGGTPSLISTKYLEPLITRLRKSFDFSNDAEFSFEANPGVILTNRLDAFKDVGFNRLTIGIQSFNDAELAFLTRIHSAKEAVQAIQLARDWGFNNIGIDLIFGIPGQTMATWRASLEEAIRLLPEHISMYGLTYEAQTPLWRLAQDKKIIKCNDDLERDMFLFGIDTLKNAGYEHYEISNFARPGFRSKHNSSYWDGSSYLGLGPSAHSFSTEKRWWNVGDLSQYINKLKTDQIPVAGSEDIGSDEMLHELILLGLRRIEGIDLNLLQRLTERSAEELIEQVVENIGDIDSVDSFAKPGKNALLTKVSDSLCLTQEGLLLYDSVCEELFKL
jgi:oxygen-independent coproporphyrinogen III oxidase